jgi:glycosyltransferase involved in cell wall biosynthesis
VSKNPVRLAYFVTHPIQYQAPLLRRIAADPSIDLTVFFATDFSLHRHFDPGFGREIAWDIDLLSGYRHEFLPVLGDRTRLSPLRPFNYGIVRRLLRGRFDAVWCHSYARVPHLTALVVGRVLGMKVFLRDEANFVSTRPGPARLFLKRRFLGFMKLVLSGILTIGTMNREYYRAIGFREERLFRMPYAVDNDWFRARIAEAAARRDAFRAELGLEPGRPVALFAAKLQRRKRAQDLIRAFKAVAGRPEARRPYLLVAGDGELRDELHALAADAPVGSIRFLGFRGQTELPPLYDICDVFVLPSDTEPWGLVTNEAMNAGRPIVATTEVGAARDLVHDGDNGFVIEPGDIDALSAALLKIFSDPEAAARMGRRSLEIVDTWSFREDVEGLREALRFYFGDRIEPRP